MALSISLMILPTMSIYAGDINAVEQDVINYCSGIFYYEGKAYKATPAAISRAYAELAADDKDLTPEQGEAAKRLVTNNIKRGIDEGYLVEVELPPETTTENNGETKDTTEITTGSQNETSGSNEETSSEEVTTDQTMETTMNSSDETGTVTPQGETTTGRFGKDEPETTEPASENKEENKVTGSGEIIDIDNILQSTNEEVIVNQNTEQQTLYNVQDYVNGEELIVQEEGEVIYQNDLPVKNTGYNLVKGKFVLLAIAVLFSGNVLAAVLFRRKQEKR